MVEAAAIEKKLLKEKKKKKKEKRSKRKKAKLLKRRHAIGHGKTLLSDLLLAKDEKKRTAKAERTGTPQREKKRPKIAGKAIHSPLRRRLWSATGKAGALRSEARSPVKQARTGRADDAPKDAEEEFWETLEEPSAPAAGEQASSRPPLPDEEQSLLALATASDGSLPSASNPPVRAASATGAQPPPPPPPHPQRRLRRGRHRSSSSSSSKMEGTTVEAVVPEYVRDVVKDYVEGQTDPDVVDQSVKKTASYLSAREPIMVENRGRFTWVAKAESGHYTHDPDAAVADRVGREEDTRCDVCGNRCSQERIFRVRCYPRRTPEDRPESEAPRVMQKQVYKTGTRCMQGLLGVPPVPAKSLVQLRERFQGALKSRKFAPKTWFEPLRRITRDESKSFAAVLHGELSRVIRDCAGPNATWRKVAAAAAAERSKPSELPTSSEGTAAPKASKGASPGAHELESDEICRDVVVRTRMQAVRTSELRCFDDDEEPGDGALTAPSPHELYEKRKGKRPPYVVAVISFGRPERLKANTLAFLRRQKVPQTCIEVWIAPGSAPGQQLDELQRYRRALARDFPRVRLEVGEETTAKQRRAITSRHAEGLHIICMDDDVPDVLEKFKPGLGHETLRPLPPGAFEALVHHAADLMQQQGADVWSLNPSTNPVNMANGVISRRCGMLSSLLMGFRNRREALKPMPEDLGAAEELEWSCNAFHRDGLMLRYLMYSARTIFRAEEGIRPSFASASSRRAGEEKAAEQLITRFPELLLLRKAEGAVRVQCCFRVRGPGPLSADGQERPRKSPDDGAQQADKDTFEFRERLRQARQEKEVLARCLALQESLNKAVDSSSSLASDAQPESAADDARSKGAGVAGTVPDVLDDILTIATKGAHSLKGLGLSAVAAEPPPLDYGPVIPKMPCSAKVAPLQPRGQALESSASLPQLAQPSHPSQPSQAPQKKDGEAFKAQVPVEMIWFGEDDPSVTSYEFTGFKREVLNRSFTADVATWIRGHRSFWDKTRTVFMYWQEKRRRWALVQRWDKDKDLLVKVRDGDDMGWAFLERNGTWSEYWQGAWQTVAVATRRHFSGLSGAQDSGSAPLAAHSAAWSLQMQLKSLQVQPQEQYGPRHQHKLDQLVQQQPLQQLPQRPPQLAAHLQQPPQHAQLLQHAQHQGQQQCLQHVLQRDFQQQNPQPQQQQQHQNQQHPLQHRQHPLQLHKPKQMPQPQPQQAPETQKLREAEAPPVGAVQCQPSQGLAAPVATPGTPPATAAGTPPASSEPSRASVPEVSAAAPARRLLPPHLARTSS
eukprot:TRINITY_DN10381_c0_g1_i1.p1 TRINITY_DN10381_c0_g1~~TRINITY_DN10381_c0_g1_i1.p1  ORF type:complete len:1421 (+),score=291.51 TRINITY_DN10381_c0_g1_i1:386-4264(+)